MQQDKVEVFIHRKKEECLKLIQYDIWDGIDSNSLRAWLRNFTTFDEKLFGACLLDWLVYRNDEQVVSMLYDLLTKHLHNQWRLDNNPLYSTSKNPLDLLCEKYGDIGFRYVTAVSNKDPGTKSGYHIVNVLNHSMGISSSWNIKAEEIKTKYESGVRTFLFIDDISGTGQQMSTVLEESKVFQLPDVNVYVLLCAAHEVGINKIVGDFPNAKVLCSEYIPKEASIFEHLPKAEFKLQNATEFHEWYNSFMEKKNVPLKNRFGRGDLGLVYAFQNNVPNDSLPLLYYNNDYLNNLLNKRGK